MADTSFSPGTTITSEWLNDINSYAYDTAVYLPRYGAIGDGVTDDSSALQDIITTFPGRVIDGLSRTYKINSTIDGIESGTVIQNATFDFSDVPDQPGIGDYIWNTTGTQGTAVALSSNANTGDYVLNVSDTSTFSVDGYAWLKSNALFEDTQAVVLGQYVQIKSIDSGTQLTLYSKVLYDYLVADTASLAPITPVQNVKFINCKFIGAGTYVQSLLNFHLCADVFVSGCSFEFCSYVACRISRTINFAAEGCSIRFARETGTSYGFAIHNGSYGVRIANSYGEDSRHFVTLGDNDGVNLFVSVIGNHIASSKDAGIDAHAAGDFLVVQGNTIEGSAVDAGTHDGIIFQGLNWICANNSITGFRRYSIFHQVLPDMGTGSSVIIGNQINNSGGSVGSEAGIALVTESGSGTQVYGAAITGNIISGICNHDIYVYAFEGNITNLTITGNTINDASDLYGCLIRAESTYALEDFTISGNVFKTSGVSNLYILGISGNIQRGTISGNTFNGGTNGVRLVETLNVIETGNYITSTTRDVLVDTGSSNIILDRRSSSIVTMTNSTYAVLDQDEYLTANRAGTITVTLPVASTWPGRTLYLRTIQAQQVDSASSNVVPRIGGSAGTAILAATDGAWAILKSDGTDWQIVAGS